MLKILTLVKMLSETVTKYVDRLIAASSESVKEVRKLYENSTDMYIAYANSHLPFSMLSIRDRP